MKKALIFFAVWMVVMLPSCETDFDVNAEWKDISIVYGILDPGQNTQYVRISKAFLGSGSALEYAKIADSLYYDTAVIRATIFEYRDNQQFSEILLKPVWKPRAADPSSPFYNPDFVKVLVYQTLPFNPFKINGNDTVWLNPAAEYRLEITNTKTGKVISSKTPLVNDFSIRKPLGNFISILNRETQNTIQWNSAKNGIRYQTMLRFHYKEFTNIFDSVAKFVDYDLGIVKSKDASGGQQIDLTYTGTSFYKFLGANIPASSTIKRHAVGVEMILAVIPEQFNTYLEVNEPSSSIVQERPEYTNITNGYGIFTSRLLKKRWYGVSSTMQTDVVAYFGTIDGSFVIPPTK